ncbi:MAG: large conductance mechanosensitive channel protein MscL [Anaerolineaceae bacterium]|nr:large conductance mechanosensitive channel protein MscL [Anaerolineaceae bacterium]
MLKEFQKFISRGNVIDLATAVIIGTAFTAIVNSLVNDIIMPLIGILLNGLDFTALALTVGEASLTYGNFIQAIINFLLIAFVVFLLVRSISKVQANFSKEKEAAAPPEPTTEEKLLTEIRDLLKTK